ncbi:MAG: toll/interleukin-1 receptor domain-containing protein [Anaerolineae bacterium]|nr:toll/interleukin-1 receptor domain-containing protein [Anaerolineae bacterium]
MSHVFVSYSKHNKEYALKFVEKLLDEGFDVWIDNRRLKTSEDWWRSIVESLRDCDAFIVIMTPESDASEWVQLEITLAFKYKKPRFPVWLSGPIDTPNWDIFARTQYYDVRNQEVPAASFYEDLAQYVKRKSFRGSNVTATGKLDKKVELMEAEYEKVTLDAIANPPRTENEDDDDVSPAKKRFPREALIAALVAVLVIGAAAVMLLTQSPPAVITPTTEPVITNTPVTPMDTSVSADLESLNTWRVSQSLPDLTPDALLNDIADRHMNYLGSISLDELPGKNLVLDADDRSAQDIATEEGYTGSVQMFALVEEDGEVTLSELIDTMIATGLDQVVENASVVGLAQDRSPDTGIAYFVLVIGTN